MRTPWMWQSILSTRTFEASREAPVSLNIPYAFPLLTSRSTDLVMVEDATDSTSWHEEPYTIPLPTSRSADLVMVEGAIGSWHDSFVPSPYSCSSGYTSPVDYSIFPTYEGYQDIPAITPDIDNVVHLPVMQSVHGEDLSPPGVGSLASNEQSLQEIAFTPGTAGQSGSTELVKDVRKHGIRSHGRVSKAKKGLKIHKCDCGRVSVSDVSTIISKIL
jgi:hypothetical protein